MSNMHLCCSNIYNFNQEKGSVTIVKAVMVMT